MNDISGDAPQSPVAISQRLPPTNIGAEQALLGAILAGPRAFPLVDGMIEARHFADPIHARIFDAAAKRVRNGGIADVVMLKGDLETAGVLDEVGGVGYLTQLLTAMVSATVSREYAQAIIDAWARRQMIDIGEALMGRAFAGQPVEEVLSAAIGEVERLVLATSAGTAQRRLKTLDEAMDAALAQADAIARGDDPIGLMTGMGSVDAVLGGMQPGDLIVLGGRPGSGKSALGHQWALHAARTGVGVLEISMEMTHMALGRRALSAASGVPQWKMRRGQHADDIAALLAARKELLGLPLSIVDGGRATGGEMRTAAKMAKRKHGLGLVLVDHLHLAKPEEAQGRSDPTAQVSAIVHGCKDLAKQMNCVVLLLSQLNRGTEGRDDHRPTLSDLRQAGAIEEDADAVALAYRPSMYLGKSPPEQKEGEARERYDKRVTEWHDRKAKLAGVAELIFEKVREGEPQTVNLRFDGPTTSFREPSFRDVR